MASGRLTGLVHGLGFGGTLYGALALTAVAAAPVRRSRAATAAVVRAVARVAVPTALRLGGVRVIGRGADHAAELARGGGYILVANHSSNLDPLALMTVLGRVDLAFVAKAETLRRPVLGSLLDAIGWIFVERESLASLKKLREDVEARRGTGWVPDLVIFPEGTRSPDGRLQKFRIGPFMLAAQTGLPILPVVIRGTSALHRKDAFAVHPGTVEVEIGAPLFPPSRKLRALEQVDVAADLLRRTEAIFRAVPELAPAGPATAAAGPSPVAPAAIAQGAS
jgi:1-acyl-sn-glycerol-3-phosphate acyltransferase